MAQVDFYFRSQWVHFYIVWYTYAQLSLGEFLTFFLFWGSSFYKFYFLGVQFFAFYFFLNFLLCLVLVINICHQRNNQMPFSTLLETNSLIFILSQYLQCATGNNKSITCVDAHKLCSSSFSDEFSHHCLDPIEIYEGQYIQGYFGAY